MDVNATWYRADTRVQERRKVHVIAILWNKHCSTVVNV